MYIAIEGIKGSGKSTIIQELLSNVNADYQAMGLFAITSPMCYSHPLELLHKEKPSLRNNDEFIEQLFLERARWNQHATDRHKPLILGDRSIATAYVTRWNKWQDPYYTIRKVNTDYCDIMKPNVIIWLNTALTMSVANIRKRSFESLRVKDEIPEMLEMASHVYEELFKDGLYQKKINRTQIIEVRNHSDIKQTGKEIQSILKYYSES